MSVIDERFLNHRLRSTSTAGIVGGVLATVLWFYRYVTEHRFDWDLFAVAVTIAAVKLALMAWYRFTD
jgi:hypothetical protein